MSGVGYLTKEIVLKTWQNTALGVELHLIRSIVVVDENRDHFLTTRKQGCVLISQFIVNRPILLYTLYQRVLLECKILILFRDTTVNTMVLKGLILHNPPPLFFCLSRVTAVHWQAKGNYLYILSQEQRTLFTSFG